LRQTAPWRPSLQHAYGVADNGNGSQMISSQSLSGGATGQGVSSGKSAQPSQSLNAADFLQAADAIVNGGKGQSQSADPWAGWHDRKSRQKGGQGRGDARQAEPGPSFGPSDRQSQKESQSSQATFLGGSGKGQMTGGVSSGGDAPPPDRGNGGDGGGPPDRPTGSSSTPHDSGPRPPARPPPGLRPHGGGGGGGVMIRR